jgi:hypothetical protein
VRERGRRLKEHGRRCGVRNALAHAQLHGNAVGRAAMQECDRGCYTSNALAHAAATTPDCMLQFQPFGRAGLPSRCSGRALRPEIAGILETGMVPSAISISPTRR